MSEQHRAERPSKPPIGEREREQIRRWRRELVGRAFTDQQAARLVFAKLLYLRGRLRD